jgi:hypothetical protein
MIPTGPVLPEEIHLEVVGSKNPKDAWIDAVWEFHHGKCSNCGQAEHVSVRMIVPEEAGGKLVLSNGIVLCRTCDVAKTAVEKAQASGKTPRRPVNVWVSKGLYEQVHTALKTKNGFRSMGSLVRHMMGMMAETPERFDDLSQWQDQGSDVKVNLWVDQKDYDVFKTVLSDKNLTVTEGVKGLLLMYTDEAAPGRRNA